MNPICATRPFQISAFFLSPNGPRPSLKFHCLSYNFVEDVEIAAACECLGGCWFVGVTNACDEMKRRARIAKRKDFILVVYFLLSFFFLQSK